MSVRVNMCFVRISPCPSEGLKQCIAIIRYIWRRPSRIDQNWNNCEATRNKHLCPLSQSRVNITASQYLNIPRKGTRALFGFITHSCFVFLGHCSLQLPVIRILFSFRLFCRETAMTAMTFIMDWELPLK
ncbi:hypothetical protein K435DRAFT_417628 [Dendrothele bispora CBS 962.96]|uniref:Uncharacterized protein n=1 Tax=Dendrothele bispora (strain CBS 962.96) TaxID=1314807 RepID=A0A4S8MW48_DENBC|nr:hypothetical protein K435DRAFT_417628 [Dendrothele bispora CBS 962.96]